MEKPSIKRRLSLIPQLPSIVDPRDPLDREIETFLDSDPALRALGHLQSKLTTPTYSQCNSIASSRTGSFSARGIPGEKKSNDTKMLLADPMLEKHIRYLQLNFEVRNPSIDILRDIQNQSIESRFVSRPIRNKFQNSEAPSPFQFSSPLKFFKTGETVPLKSSRGTNELLDYSDEIISARALSSDSDKPFSNMVIPRSNEHIQAAVFRHVSNNTALKKGFLSNEIPSASSMAINSKNYKIPFKQAIKGPLIVETDSLPIRKETMDPIVGDYREPSRHVPSILMNVTSGRKEVLVMTTPAVGTYNVNKADHVPSIQFGNITGRNEVERDELPPPGLYNIKNFTRFGPEAPVSGFMARASRFPEFEKELKLKAAMKKDEINFNFEEKKELEKGIIEKNKDLNRFRPDQSLMAKSLSAGLLVIKNIIIIFSETRL